MGKANDCFDRRLTKREQNCLYLSAQGKGIKEIASFLKMSDRRVVQYRQAIFQKLGCKNIVEAITVEIRYGEIDIYKEWMISVAIVQNNG